MTTVDAAKKEQAHSLPWFLPDGRRFLYVTTPPTTVYVGSLDSEERTPLLASESRAIYADGYLLFMRQGTLLAQSFDAARLRIIGESFPVAENVGADANPRRRGLFGIDDGRADVSGWSWRVQHAHAIDVGRSRRQRAGCHWSTGRVPQP